MRREVAAGSVGQEFLHSVIGNTHPGYEREIDQVLKLAPAQGRNVPSVVVPLDKWTGRTKWGEKRGQSCKNALKVYGRRNTLSFLHPPPPPKKKKTWLIKMRAMFYQPPTGNGLLGQMFVHRPLVPAGLLTLPSIAFEKRQRLDFDDLFKT